MERVLVGENLLVPDNKVKSEIETLRNRADGIILPGIINNTTSFNVKLSNVDLSKHMLFIGGIGMGKTNGIFYVVKSIRNNMTNNDVMVIFDTKGDYIDEFSLANDIVISNDKQSRNGSNIDYWNIFEEIPGKNNKDKDKLYDNVYEISKELFDEKISKAKDPFFINAAMQIFAGLLFNFINETNDIKALNNKFLSDFFTQECNVKQICDWLACSKKTENLINYIYGDNEQSQGVISELVSYMNEIFIGNFRKAGGISIRQAVHSRGNKVIFVKYDIASAKSIVPIYRFLIDMALKQSLIQSSQKGNVYFIIDEFRLLPKLNYLDNGINFGRSLGVKILIGMQNFNQVKTNYNEYEALSLLAGLSTIVAFGVNDDATRKVIRESFGTNIKELQYRAVNLKDGFRQHIFNGNVVEDWYISKLRVGEAIIKTPYIGPFLFKFKEYKGK